MFWVLLLFAVTCTGRNVWPYLNCRCTRLGGKVSVTCLLRWHTSPRRWGGIYITVFSFKKTYILLWLHLALTLLWSFPSESYNWTLQCDDLSMPAWRFTQCLVPSSQGTKVTTVTEDVSFREISLNISWKRMGNQIISRCKSNQEQSPGTLPLCYDVLKS